jgi:hypothetical protein
MLCRSLFYSAKAFWVHAIPSSDSTEGGQSYAGWAISSMVRLSMFRGALYSTAPNASSVAIWDSLRPLTF